MMMQAFIKRAEEVDALLLSPGPGWPGADAGRWKNYPSDLNIKPPDSR